MMCEHLERDVDMLSSAIFTNSTATTATAATAATAAVATTIVTSDHVETTGLDEEAEVDEIASTSRCELQRELWYSMYASCRFFEPNRSTGKWNQVYFHSQHSMTAQCTNKIMIYIWRECLICILSPSQFECIPASGVLRRVYARQTVCDIGADFRHGMRLCSAAAAGEEERVPRAISTPGIDSVVHLMRMTGSVVRWDGRSHDCLGTDISSIF